MRIRKISREERDKVLSFSSLNQRKDFLQDIQIKELAQQKKVIYELATGFGNI